MGASGSVPAVYQQISSDPQDNNTAQPNESSLARVMMGLSKHTHHRATKVNIPIHVQVAHYMPSTFPLIPKLLPEHLPICRKSWQIIVAQRQRLEEYGTDIHGITLFYNEFYERLSKIDVSGYYETILMRHAVGTNKIAAKGAILVRIVDFILKLDGDTTESKKKLDNMGIIHKHLEVRPWQYSVFLEIFLHTLTFRLGEQATPEILEAWVHLLAFTLKYMLPSAIEGVPSDSEIHSNIYQRKSPTHSSMNAPTIQLPTPTTMETNEEHNHLRRKSTATVVAAFSTDGGVEEADDLQDVADVVTPGGTLPSVVDRVDETIDHDDDKMVGGDPLLSSISHEETPPTYKG